ncbi:MAG: amidohydrolase [Candidatus Heimdallarchaeota archaeon]|nr:MAG: amidohydrolase [Candidatus Heimdallarchaeota archaeon]
MKVIVNATILCPSQGLIENGSILFDEEKIHAIGTELTIPEGTEVIHAEGKFVLPGFIDAHTHQGLFEGGIGWAGRDGNEMTDPITPHLRGLDSFNPDEKSLKEVLKGGVTCINTGPGSGNVISGQAFVVKPFGGTVVDEMVLLAPSGLKIALGENPKRVHGQENKRMPQTRMGIAGLLRKTFTDANNYIKEWETYRKRLEMAEKHGKAPPIPPKHDLGMDTIIKVIRKEIPLHAHAHRADDIATIIRISEEFDIRSVLIHCTEGEKIADYIAAKGVPAVIGPTIMWVSKPETRRRSFKTVVSLVKAGVKVALQTDSLTPMNFFQLLPMYAIKEGLTREEALKCVTKNPAEILGIYDRVGSLDVEKDADIVIWSGHPFEFYSKVEKVFINGKEVYAEKN